MFGKNIESEAKLLARAVETRIQTFNDFSAGIKHKGVWILVNFLLNDSGYHLTLTPSGKTDDADLVAILSLAQTKILEDLNSK